MTPMVDPSSLLGLIVDSRYRLATVVGTGSYGWVYAADETAFGEVIGQVAVKLLRPPDEDARKAVIREVQAMAQLSHAHLLGFRSAGQVSDGLASGCLYIATELASETLEARLRSAQRMMPNEVREVAEHMASAMAHLCERGAVHRDVKPANILRVGNVWKLGDFGLVRGFAGTGMQASGRKGTVLYMSPEAMQGETGPFVDVWALGAVIQECLTGTLPYSGNSDTEIIAAALTRDPSISSDLSEPFASIVRSCLVKDRKRRSTAKQVLDALRSPVHPQAVAIPAPEPRVATPAPPVHGTPRSGEVRINPKDGAEMVYIPAGEFIMGSDGGGDEKPRRKVYLDGYWMYQHEITVAQYRRFCSETGRKMPDAPSWGWKNDHPIVNVSWHDAKAYAAWAGVQLPTEAQWEKAARGTDGREYPWGSTFDSSKAVCSVRPRDENSTAPVGSIPAGASPYGCLDMAGNVWEWCADWYDGGYYRKAPNRNPTGPASGTLRVLRGGSWILNL
ncbi:MAG: hypothetical protein FJX72_20420, partial [Armatimonadetes bacterium]|nr:hypothetical protein [Armatimonadota bacterium]